jgi:hypothetical protein
MELFELRHRRAQGSREVGDISTSIYVTTRILATVIQTINLHWSALVMRPKEPTTSHLHQHAIMHGHLHAHEHGVLCCRSGRWVEGVSGYCHREYITISSMF